MPRVTFNGTKINVEFTESSSRQQLNSGENISTLFGKIKKIFSDLKAVCFSGSYNDLSNKPSSLPANGGNADTVDNLHADDFVNATNRDNNQIPNNADVPAWIHANCKRYKIYMTNGANIGMTNIPNDTTDYVWYWYDGINIIAREWATGKYYICDVVNGGFSGWKDIYTSGYKPYETGTVTIIKPNIATISLDFIPSFILYAKKDTLTQNLLLATHADIGWFRGNLNVDDIVYYIAFK